MPTPRRPPARGPKIRVTGGPEIIREFEDRRSGIEDRKRERRVRTDKRFSEFRTMQNNDVGKIIPLDVWERTRQLFKFAWNIDSKVIMDSVGEWRVLGPFPEKDSPEQNDPGSRTVQLDHLASGRRVLIRSKHYENTAHYYISTTRRTQATDRRKYDRRTGKGYDVQKIE